MDTTGTATQNDISPFFDRTEQLKSWWNILPHWEQRGKIQSVTFRLADSLPQCKLLEIREKKNWFLRQYPKPWDKDTESRYRRIISVNMDRYLDAGYGSCILKNPELRRIVSDSLEFYDGKRYHLIAYVVMPNHVHALVEMSGEYEANCTFEDLKRFTARRIKSVTGGKDGLWGATFDRLIRDEKHLKYCVSYIRDNPRYLPSEYYTLGGPALR